MVHRIKIIQLTITSALPLWARQSRLQQLSAACALALGLGLCPPSYAQQAPVDTSPAAQLSVEDLVTFALKHNASLQTGLRSLDIARAAVITSSALPNPRVEFDSGRNSAAHTASQAGTVTAVGISQLIENPALRSARVDSALHAENTSVEALGQIRNELIAQVKLRAYEYLLRREEALAASDALELLEQIRERVRLRVETGEAGRYELIKSDAEIVNARQKKQTAQLQIAQAAISLNRLAGGQLPARWELDGQLGDAHELPQLANLRETALRENPELRVLASELDRNKARINEAEASRWPGVDIKLAQVNQPDVRQNMVGLSVQIPLLDQKRGPRAEAIAERERTLTRLEGRRAELLQQLELSWKSIEIAQIRIKALSEGAMRDAEAALRVAQAAYRFGERGILEVLDAERVLRAVRQDLLLARYQLQASLIDLDSLAGKHATSRPSIP